MKYNAIFFVESVVPDLMEEVCQESWGKAFQGILAHLDNARPHSSGKSEAVLTETKARRIPAPVYSPDLSLSDFFFFGVLKERMSGTSYSSPDELISAISELIASLPKGQLVSVYKNWIKLLNWVIRYWGSTTASE
jgi:transposase